MSEHDDAMSDEAMADLLGRVGDDPSLRPPDRDGVRAAMLAEFDAIAGVPAGQPAGASRQLELVPSPTERGDMVGGRRRPTVWWPAAAAACLVVVALAVVSGLRDESSTSDTVDPSVPTTSDTLPTVDASEMLTGDSLPQLLDDRIYRSDVVRESFSFAGAGGLQLVALRDGLMVLDSVSPEGDVRARVSLFEADSDSVDAVISNAVAAGQVLARDAQFTTGEGSLSRRDLTVTADGVDALSCVGQESCFALTTAVDGEAEEDDEVGEVGGVGDAGTGRDDVDPSVWARSENFLIEIVAGERGVFVLMQSKRFGDPLLGQAFEFVDSLRLN